MCNFPLHGYWYPPCYYAPAERGSEPVAVTHRAPLRTFQQTLCIQLICFAWFRPSLGHSYRYNAHPWLGHQLILAQG